MKAGLIVIGDEILSGRVRDANAPWLARRLAERGIALHGTATVGDDAESVARALRCMPDRVRAVVTSGGLGPTADDVTREALARALGRPLREDARARAAAEAHHERAGRAWDPSRNGYHLVPEGAEPVGNPAGLAPGLAVEDGGRTVLAAPGEPSEFRAMALEGLLPRMERILGGGAPLRHIAIRTHGAGGEEAIFHDLAPGLWGRLSELGRVSSLPAPGGVDVLVAVRGGDFEAALERAREAVGATPLADRVWSWDDAPPEEALVREAAAKGLTLSLAESCTGGLASSLVTDVPGSSAVFLGGLVTYANALKRDVLGVRGETLARHGAVSGETAREMALGARERTGSDLALGLTGVAGPGGGSPTKPVGTLALALAHGGGAEARLHRFQGDRGSLKAAFARTGILALLGALRSLPPR